MYPQLNLDIQPRVEFRLSNFIGATAQTSELLQKLANLQSLSADQPLLIYGEAGAGKSHLLQSACHLAGELNYACSYLPLGELATSTPELLAGLDQLDLLCIDDLHLIAGQPQWELGLFNLYNECREHGCRLLFASQRRPVDCNFQLDDLTSRLGWGLIYALPELNDEQKKTLVQKRAHQLGLTFDAATCDYIMARCHRQTSKLMQFLDQLDEHSLAGQRRITIPLVRDVIQHRSGDHDLP